MIVGFLLALLFSKQFPLRRYLMILVLIPMMLSFVAVGAFFRYYYDPTFGLLSQAVRFFTGHPYTLMGTVWGSRAGIVFADAWMWSPFVMLLVLAGLVSVPKYLYEAAAIDRVPRWRQFVSITFPYIKGLLLLALLFRTIEAFKLFDLVFLLTNGGPGTATETIALRVLSNRVREQQDKQVDGACLHPTFHCHRAHQPLPLFRQADAQKVLNENAERIGEREFGGNWPPFLALGNVWACGSMGGVGVAGWGRTAVCRDRQLHLLLPGAMDHPDRVKTYEDALAVPAKFIFTPTLANFFAGLSAAPIPWADKRRTRIRALFFQFVVHIRG